MFQLSFIKDELTDDNKDYLKINKRRAVRGVIMYKGSLLMVKTANGDYKFPGGGVDKYEDDKYALLREIREETGYVDVEVAFCIGTAFEQNLDTFQDNTMFQMDSVYYLCKLRSLEQLDPKLDDYERELEFKGEFVSVDDAYINNKSLESGTDQASAWLDRETAVLGTLRDSLVDKLLLDIYECGQIMKSADRTDVHIDGKDGHANFVTNYDKQIQNELKKRLLAIYKDASFVGEEDDEKSSISDGFALIVDPIDGTTNFMKDYKMSCISVGITYNGEQVAGIVYQPYANEMYTAQLGQGAYLNGNPIHVSNSPLENSLVVFGTAPYYEELTDKSFAKAREVIRYCIDVRRSGSAALDLCSVAVGRADMFFEYRICPWDIAAGSIIVTEAGGQISTIEGTPITLEDKCSILATNGVTYLP